MALQKTILLFTFICLSTKVYARDCTATREIYKGESYFVVFLPIHFQNSTFFKKGLDIALTLQLTAYPLRKVNYGLIIFDTCNDVSVITEELLMLYMDKTLLKETLPLHCYDDESCSKLYLNEKINGIIGFVDAASALQLGHFFSSVQFGIFVQIIDKQDQIYEMKALEAYHNVIIVHHVEPVQILIFVLEYNKWFNITVVITDTLSEEYLKISLKKYCVNYIHLSPLLKFNDQNNQKVEKLIMNYYKNLTKQTDAIILWTSSVQVIYPFLKNLKNLPPVVMSWDVYGKYFMLKNKHYPVTTISRIELSANTYSLEMIKYAVMNTWAKEYIIKENVPLKLGLFKLQLTYRGIFENYLFQYAVNGELPVISGDYLYSQVKTVNKTKLQVNNICESITCRPGYHPMWKSWRRPDNDSDSIYDESHHKVCIKCKLDYYKLHFGQCQSCPTNTTSNLKRTGCLSKTYDYLKWNGTIAILMYVFISIAITFNLMILVVFIKFRNTPVVISSNRRLSFTQLTAHIFLSLTLLLFIGTPTFLKCVTITTTIGFLLVLILTITLAKTQKLLMIFQAPQMLNQKEIAMTGLVENMLIATFLFVQIIITFVSLIFFKDNIIKLNDRNTIHIACSNKHLYIQLVYVWLLAIFCLVQAFRARKLPASYNETKFIVFAMLSMVVMLSIMFLPISIQTANTKETTITTFQFVYCTNIITVFILFGYKLWIILFRPHKNTKDTFQKSRFQLLYNSPLITKRET